MTSTVVFKLNSGCNDAVLTENSDFAGTSSVSVKINDSPTDIYTWPLPNFKTATWCSIKSTKVVEV